VAGSCSTRGTTTARRRRSAAESTSFRASRPSELPGRPRALVALALGAVLFAAACAAGAESTATSTGVVLRVSDGDTLTLRGGARVRLVQIDAPEAGRECYARRSTAELGRLAAPGTRLTLELDPALDARDRFGRLLRYVLIGGENVNVELVRRGAAAPYFFDGDRGRYATELLDAVQEARAGRRGMWAACRVSWRPEAPVDTRPR
jgi:micrococcal nuclease